MMGLADLLAETSQEDLERLAHEHARADESMPRAQLLDTIASVLRSHRFLHDYLFNRQPPTFAILTLLLDAEGNALPAATFKQAVMAETARICTALDTRAILARNDQLRVYRRVLYQARSNDRSLDASEAAILSVLRQELVIEPVEHFLIEHHADFREFWSQEEAFLREINALRSAGLVFVNEARFVLPADLVKTLRRVLGIEMRTSGFRRILGHLTSPDLQEVLSDAGLPSGGSKDERLERIVAHMMRARVVLLSRKLDTVKEVAEAVGAGVTGNKEALIERIIARVDGNHDVAVAPEPPAPPKEPRQLDEVRFQHLFSTFRGHELAAVLAQFDLRRWGVKPAQVRALWDAHRSEATLLGALSSADLESVLKRLELKTAGSKGERIQRLIEYFGTVALPAQTTQSAPDMATTPLDAASP